ncbi:MAG: hypothetical protein Q9170_005857 [Blastenia crenularia]
MPASSTTSSKRMRSSNDDAQRPLDPSEELSQVAGLVERRRLQNKISQRNYRNRIRDRLEALEALVDNTSKGQSANTSKSPGNTRTTKLGTVKRKIEEGSRQSPPNPQDHPATLPSENSNPWNMGDFLDTSATQFDTMYDFPAPQSPVSPQAFTTHMSTRECSPTNHTTSTMASISGHSKQSTVAGMEELHGTAENPRPMEEIPAHVGSANISPQSPNNQSVPFNPISYGYPITPMSMPMQPLTPGSLAPHLEHHDSSGSDHVTQPNPYPFHIPSMQNAGYFQPQQFVWVPVPIMTLPPPPPPPSSMMTRPPVVRPEALSGDGGVGRQC